MAGDRTEKPTAKRLRDARDKGQTIRSRELGTGVALLVTALVMAWGGGWVMERVGMRLALDLSRLGDEPLRTITATDLGNRAAGDAWVMLLACGPPMLASALAIVGTSVAQTGWVIAGQAISLDFGRLSPAKGFSRFAPMQGGIELLRTSIGAVVVGVVAWVVARTALADSVRLPLLAPVDAARVAASTLLQLFWRVSAVWLAFGALDYGLQYWRTHQSLKMTKQEVKDETRMTDGSPEIKARVRQAQRLMTRRRMLSAVKTATVVVTNPTHFAVALQYRRGVMPAPLVVAKGQDLMAGRIKAVARSHGVPIVENVALAQALYKGAEIGEMIPSALFGAVAEVLAYLVRIKELML